MIITQRPQCPCLPLQLFCCCPHPAVALMLRRRAPWRPTSLTAAASLPDLLHCHFCLFVALQGILAANIFDWGAKACVELYTNGTILDIYREVRDVPSPEGVPRSYTHSWGLFNVEIFCERAMAPTGG